MNSILSFLLGSWFICSTNFPMWTKGNKTDPTFNYSRVPAKENVLADDVRYYVRYYKKGRQKSIKGYDYWNSKTNTFTWRGKGLLKPITSNWRVALADSSGEWAVIYFSKTLFTPEGIDVISRTKNPAPEKIEWIKAEMLKDSVLKKHVPLLKNLYH